MKAKTILTVTSLLVLIMGALPFLKDNLPASIPTSGTIYQAVLIIIGLIGIVAGFSNPTKVW
jgi:hypothetical protein